MTSEREARAEAERLRALRAYDILDTAPEETFDRVVRLAAALTGAPVALVTLLDEQRAWFKAALGRELSEIPREQSFCDHVLGDPGVLVVEDAALDPRFAASPVVTGPPYVRFYAGAPLRSRSGHTVGALCVLDDRPRRLDAAQIDRLADLAETVVDALELRRAAREFEAEAAALREAQQALAASEARHRSVLDTAVDAIISIDDEGRIDSANPACARLFGYAPGELIGQEVTLLMPRSEVSRHEEALSRYRQTGKSKLINGPGREVTGRRRDGSHLPIHLAVSETEVGGRTRFTAIIRDITDLRAVQTDLLNALALMHAVVDDSPDPIFIKDMEGRYLLLNAATAQALGRPQAEVLGRGDADFLPAGIVARLRRTDDEVTAGGVTVTAEEILPAAAGGSTVYLTTKSPLIGADGRIAGVVGIARDITARKEAEEAMIRAREQADRANSAKTEFLSNMSHELRTPLNAVLGFSQMLEMNQEKEPLTPTQRKCVGHIHRAGEHLLDLINEILDLAKIETGRLTLMIEPVDARAVVMESLSLVAPMAAPAELALRFAAAAAAPPPRVLADGIRLKQVVVNLLSNAIKYNRRGGSVTVIEAVPADGRLRLTVADTGRGIAPEHFDEVFQPFSRLAADAAGIEGTGIGLTITRRLVLLMGGAIGVDSRVGEGSSFWIEMPVAPGGGAGSDPADRW
ncbi:MAG: PAS domain S-box protein [Rhodospirillaceae bacterium]